MNIYNILTHASGKDGFNGSVDYVKRELTGSKRKIDASCPEFLPTKAWEGYW